MAIVDELLNLFRTASGVDLKRSVTLLTERGKYIYDDGQAKYNPLIPALNRGISTVESFSQVVVEEGRRLGNATGDFMTAIFTQKGGVFYPDDKARNDQWGYERCLSQQWLALQAGLNKEMKHLDFIRFLQGIRPSIADYPSISREFRKVTFDGTNSVTSQPVIENGNAGATVSFVLNTKNAATETSMPGEIQLSLPFTKGGEKLYNLTLELDVALTDGKILFRPVCPDIETVSEQAISDEVAYFKEQTKGLPELLVLLDY